MIISLRLDFDQRGLFLNRLNYGKELIFGLILRNFGNHYFLNLKLINDLIVIIFQEMNLNCNYLYRHLLLIYDSKLIFLIILDFLGIEDLFLIKLIYYRFYMYMLDYCRYNFLLLLEFYCYRYFHCC